MDTSLPHYSSRNGEKIDAIVLHYPAPNLTFEKPYSVEALHALLMEHRLSYHYYITKDGTRHQFVADQHKAWHAGQSTLFGRDNVNLFSIGVCMENNGGEPYGLPLLIATATLCHELVEKYRIPKHHIVGHSHVSPGRKEDPGSRFPWFALFEYI